MFFYSYTITKGIDMLPKWSTPVYQFLNFDKLLTSRACRDPKHIQNEYCGHLKHSPDFVVSSSKKFRVIRHVDLKMFKESGKNCMFESCRNLFLTSETNF
eukprot:UN25888